MLKRKCSTEVCEIERLCRTQAVQLHLPQDLQMFRLHHQLPKELPMLRQQQEGYQRTGSGKSRLQARGFVMDPQLLQKSLLMHLLRKWMHQLSQARHLQKESKMQQMSLQKHRMSLHPGLLLCHRPVKKSLKHCLRYFRQQPVKIQNLPRQKCLLGPYHGNLISALCMHLLTKRHKRQFSRNRVERLT